MQGFARAAALASLVVLFAGCGGGGEPQDANETAGEFPLDVVNATFPKAQGLGQTSSLKITVRNAGDAAVPTIAMTVDGMATKLTNPDAGDPSRPVWVVNQQPYGADTAYVGTWTLGALPAGEERTFTWQVTATRPGTHTLKYRAGAGLDGKAAAVAADGGKIDGAITVRVTRRPRDSVVDPQTGDVIERSERSAR